MKRTRLALIALGLCTFYPAGCGLSSLATTIKEDRDFARVHECHRHVVQYTDDKGRQHTVEDSTCQDTKEPKR